VALGQTLADLTRLTRRQRLHDAMLDEGRYSTLSRSVLRDGPRVMCMVRTSIRVERLSWDVGVVCQVPSDSLCLVRILTSLRIVIGRLWRVHHHLS